MSSVGFFMSGLPKVYYYAGKVSYLGVFNDFVSYTFHKSSFYHYDADSYSFNLDHS